MVTGSSCRSEDARFYRTCHLGDARLVSATGCTHCCRYRRSGNRQYHCRKWLSSQTNLHWMMLWLVVKPHSCHENMWTVDWGTKAKPKDCVGKATMISWWSTSCGNGFTQGRHSRSHQHICFFVTSTKCYTLGLIDIMKLLGVPYTNIYRTVWQSKASKTTRTNFSSVRYTRYERR